MDTTEQKNAETTEPENAEPEQMDTKVEENGTESTEQKNAETTEPKNAEHEQMDTKVEENGTESLKRKAPDEVSEEAPESKKPTMVPSSSNHKISDELKEKILNQIDFYFGNSNFRKDKFLLERTSADPDRYLPLSVLLTFKKLRQMTEDPAVVVDSISSSQIVELSECKTKLRRRHPLPEIDDSDERTLFVKGLGFNNEEINSDALKRIFKPCGEIGWCRLIFRKVDEAEEKEEKADEDGWTVAKKKRAKRVFGGTAFVEFLTKEGAENALATPPEFRGKPLHLERKKSKKRDAPATATQPFDDKYFPKGWIVKATPVHHEANWVDLKDAIKEKGVPAFVEHKKGEQVALLRMSSAKDAEAVATAYPEGIEFHTMTVKFSVLEGEEEEKYWSNVPIPVKQKLREKAEPPSVQPEVYEEGLLIKVSGLAAETSWKDLKTALQEKGAETAFVQIEGGVGTVRIKSKENADRILEEYATITVEEATWTLSRVEGDEEKTFYEEFTKKKNSRPNDRQELRFEEGIVISASDVPASLSWREIKDAIEEKGGNVGFIQMNAGGKAVIRMQSKETADTFIEKHSELEIDGTKVTFAKVVGEEEKEFHRHNRRGGRGGGRGGRGRGRGRGGRRHRR